MMRLVELVVGGGGLDRRVDDVEALLLAYRSYSGAEYLDHEPRTRLDELVPEDLAVTSLINSRFTMDAFRSLALHGHEVDLRSLPDVPLEQTTVDERGRVADLVATVAQWRGFGASVATKVLHKKRPALIPILDNQAIFGAYMNPLWPERPSHTIEPSRSRIQLFDSIWWMHFRQVEPVAGSTPAESVPVAAPKPPPKSSSAGALDRVVVFEKNERGYLAWLDAHPNGYVLSSYPRPKASYLKLHRVSCGRISGTPPRGSTWTTPYVKVCAEDRAAIEAWVLKLTSAEVSPCRWCLA